MFVTKSLWASWLVLASIQHSDNQVEGNKIGLLNEVGNMAGYLLNKCFKYNPQRSQDEMLSVLQSCLRRRSLIALDRTANIQVIKLSERVSLVKRRDLASAYNATKDIRRLGGTDKSINDVSDWKTEVWQKLRDIFRTHVLKIRLNGFDISHFEARHRRKGNMMGQLLMFGMMAAGLIVIPMGFQFLAVLGGKALLLAKLALLLTSIQGLKKIATSHMNYGLYSTGHGYTQGPWHFDRQWPYELDEHSTYGYTVEQPHADLLHPVHSSLHPRQDLLEQTY